MTPEIKELESNYKDYIDNHRHNVSKALIVIKSNPECMELISKNLNTSIESSIRLIDMLVEAHDLSKYDTEEFDAYRKNFYPVNEEEKEANKDAFELAWVHHYTNNLHHWDWWYKSGNIDNMKMPYIVEMICDWEENNKQNIHLGEKQRLFAEGLMNIINK